MALDDLAVLPDQHRVREFEPADAVGNLPDLLLGIGSGVTGIGPQPAPLASVRWPFAIALGRRLNATPTKLMNCGG